MLLSRIEIGPVGIFTSFEPETPALQGQCSTTELRALLLLVSVISMKIVWNV